MRRAPEGVRTPPPRRRGSGVPRGTDARRDGAPRGGGIRTAGGRSWNDPRRLPRCVSRAPGAGDLPPAEAGALLDPGPRGRGAPKRRSLLRSRGALQRAPAGDVRRARPRQGGRDRGDGRPHRRDREPRMRDAARGGAPRARGSRPRGPSDRAPRSGLPDGRCPPEAWETTLREITTSVARAEVSFGARLERRLPRPLRTLIDELEERDVLLYASGLAFYALVSIAPLVIVIMWIVAALLGGERVQRLADGLQRVARVGP